MSRGPDDSSDEVGRLKSELEARDRELTRLQEVAHHKEHTIAVLRDARSRDAEQIDRLEEQTLESERIEDAQRALIRELRAEVGDATELTESIATRLRAAEHELVDLRAIRDALVEPTLVQRAGMAIAAEVIPAERHVGGDFFFVGDGPNGTTVMAIGDVVGHGLPAVRRSAFTRTAFASVAPFSDNPCQLLQWVNVALVARIGESADFVTAMCAIFDPHSRLLRLASAGHHPALQLRSGAELTPGRTGAALGLGRDIDCSASSYRLDVGDGVLLYTDGLTEARGEQTRYGIDRVSTLLRDRPELTPQETLRLLKRVLRDFAGERLTDDVGLLILRAE